MQPTALEPILPTYLYRYRRGGQYADLTRGHGLEAGLRLLFPGRSAFRATVVMHREPKSAPTGQGAIDGERVEAARPRGCGTSASAPVGAPARPPRPRPPRRRWRPAEGAVLEQFGRLQPTAPRMIGVAVRKENLAASSWFEAAEIAAGHGRARARQARDQGEALPQGR